MTNTQEMQRINPVHYVVVWDKVTGTERKLEVSERAYNSIRQGEIYKSAEIEKF